MTNERKEVCDHVEVSLKEYFDTKFSALEKATELARSEMERRLAGLNELRQDVVKDRSQFVTRELYDRLKDDVSDVQGSFTRFAVVAGIIVTLLQVAEPIALYFIFHK